MRVVIVGAGGHAQVIADVVLNCGRSGEDVQLAGFVDDNASLLGKEFLGAKVLGAIGQLNAIEHDTIVIGTGDNATRARVFQQLKQHGESFATLIHPCAILAPDVIVDEGTVVFAGAIINNGSIIGPNVIVNTGATIDHHARIGAHVHIAPGAHLGGAVTIGEGAFLGIGSNVIPNRSIGQWTVVGAGATVIEDLPESVTAVGVPARIVKTHLRLKDELTL